MTNILFGFCMSFYKDPFRKVSFLCCGEKNDYSPHYCGE